MANKKITELPLIHRVSGSVGYLPGDLKSVIPIVVAGTTTQMIAEDFSKFVNAYNAHTGSAGNTFKGPQTIQSTLSVTGNASVGGNLVVAGRITAEEFHTEITTASVIYASGSTKFGDTSNDIHEFTGSIQIGGETLGNAGLNAFTASASSQLSRILQTTASIQFQTASLLEFTASQADRNFVLSIVTGSINQATASIQAQTASLLQFTASQDSRNFTLSQVTASFNYFYQASASLQTFTASQADRNLVLSTVTGSLNQATASIQTQTASLLAFTASQDGRNFTLSQVTASFNYFYQATASLQAFSSSQADRNLVLSTVTGSINQATASLQAFTASQADRNLILSTVTGSINQATASIQTQTASLLEFTASQDGRNLTLSTVTGSLIGITNGLMAFTAALDNTYATDAQLYQLYQATRSLELHSGSMVGVTNGLMEYTASLKGQAIVSSSTQVQNYDLFALNSNLYTSTGSIKGEIAGIEAYTASLKAAISVSGTNVQIIGDLNVNKLNVQYISSSVLVTSGSNTFGDQSTDKHEFTGSVYLQNSLILGTEVLGNSGLNAISASTRIELNSIEEYTASLKTAAIVSSSTQVQNYDVFGLNSNLYNSTGSLIGITNGLMELTASLKSQSILSGSGLTNYVPIYNGTTALSSSIIFQSTGSIGTGGKGITIGSDVAMYKFAVNPIANTYFGIGYTDTDSIFMTAVDNTYLPKPIVYAASSYKWYANSLTSTYNLTMVIQSSSLNVGFGGIENPLHKVDISGSARVSNGMTVSGSLLASGSSHTIQNGYVILQQVSQSLNFVDDTAAAAGGVPLGGLYRNGNFIVIRIV